MGLLLLFFIFAGGGGEGGGLLLGPGNFLGFDFCLHSIIPVTWNPEYRHPRALKKQSVEIVPASMGFKVCYEKRI